MNRSLVGVDVAIVHTRSTKKDTSHFVFACDLIHAFMKNSSVYKSWLWLMKWNALTWTLYIMVCGLQCMLQIVTCMTTQSCEETWGVSMTFVAPLWKDEAVNGGPLLTKAPRVMKWLTQDRMVWFLFIPLILFSVGESCHCFWWWP